MFKYFSILFTSILLVSCGKDVSYLFVDNSKEAVFQIKNLEQSATNFYQQNGRMPGDCYEEMEQYGAIEMKQSVIDAWEFQCDWIFDEDEREISGTVTATSTEANEAGPGKSVVYDLKSGEVTGYGQGEQE